MCAITLNPITSKTLPTFGSPREMCLIYNREMFLRWHGLESTPRRPSQAEEVPLYYFLCTSRVCSGCYKWDRGVPVAMWAQILKELNFLSDLGHIQRSGHFLQLCLYCAVAEGSFQNRLFNSQELTHLFQICKYITKTCSSNEMKAKSLVIVCDDWTQSLGQLRRKWTLRKKYLVLLKYLCSNM